MQWCRLVAFPLFFTHSFFKNVFGSQFRAVEDLKTHFYQTHTFFPSNMSDAYVVVQGGEARRGWARWARAEGEMRGKKKRAAGAGGVSVGRPPPPGGHITPSAPIPVMADPCCGPLGWSPDLAWRVSGRAGREPGVGPSRLADLRRRPSDRAPPCPAHCPAPPPRLFSESLRKQQC